MSFEVRDVTAGLWLWRQPHWEWREGDDWEPEVSSLAVESRGETVLLDPLAPPPSATEVWTRLDAPRPTAIVVLKADRVPRRRSLRALVWGPLKERTLPALRVLFDLPFEHVLVSHGEPVHDRAAFEAALEREPWSRPSGA